MTANLRPTDQSTVRLNAMSVDVEDYFQVSAFERHIVRSEWPAISCRVEANVEKILQLFERHQVKATFFTLGWIAERYPTMVRRIVAAGHELASHGWEHRRVSTQQPESFLEDVSRTRKLLEDLSGEAVKGYRAPSYSIDHRNLWAWDVLQAAGYQYSSSVVPVRHDLYGMPEAPRFAFRTQAGGLLEIPVSTLSVAGHNINCGGGGWFRLFPYRFSRWSLARINQRDQRACVFYFHPWELDPGQPKVLGIGLKTRFRHYLNLHKTEARLERLLADFSWGRMDHIFLNETDPVLVDYPEYHEPAIRYQSARSLS